MARHLSGRLPVDRARDRKPSPDPQNGISTEGLYVPPVDPVTQFKAVRAIEKHRQVTGQRYLDMADVLFALGLIEPKGGTEAHPAVPKDFDCPTCDAPRGRGCLSGDGRDMRFHVARIRLADNANTERAAEETQPIQQEESTPHVR